MITLKVSGIGFSGSVEEWRNLFNKLDITSSIDDVLIPDQEGIMYSDVKDPYKRAAIIVFADSFTRDISTVKVQMKIEEKFGVRTLPGTCNKWRSKVSKSKARMSKSVITAKYKPMADIYNKKQ